MVGNGDGERLCRRTFSSFRSVRQIPDRRAAISIHLSGPISGAEQRQSWRARGAIERLGGQRSTGSDDGKLTGERTQEFAQPDRREFLQRVCVQLVGFLFDVVRVRRRRGILMLFGLAFLIT